MEKTWIYVFWSRSSLDLWDALFTIGEVSYPRSEKPIWPEDRQVSLFQRQCWINLVGKNRDSQTGLRGKPDSWFIGLHPWLIFSLSPNAECLIYDIVVTMLTSIYWTFIPVWHQMRSCSSFICFNSFNISMRYSLPLSPFWNEELELQWLHSFLKVTSLANSRVRIQTQEVLFQSSHSYQLCFTNHCLSHLVDSHVKYIRDLCCITKYHTFNCLKQHPFLSSWFCRSEVQDRMSGFSAQDWIKV